MSHSSRRAAKATKSKYYKMRLLIGMCLLGLLLFIAVIVAWSEYGASLRRVEVIKMELLELTRSGFRIRNETGAFVFRMIFRTGLLDLESCTKEDDVLNCTRTLPGTVNFSLRVEKPRESMICYHLFWRKSIVRHTIEHRMSYSFSFLYGGAENNSQHWPVLVSGVQAPRAFVTADLSAGQPGFGSVLQRYWLSSNGTAVKISESVPFHFGWNASEQQLYFQARYHDTPYKPPPGQQPFPHLRYHVCVGSDITSIHKHMVRSYFGKPTKVPDSNVFSYPIWSTSAFAKSNVTMDALKNHVNDIKSKNFNCSHLVLHDGYTLYYGDFDPDPARFPKVSEEFKTLKDDGFPISLWVHPFINYNSSKFADGVERGLFVRESTGKLPALVRWRNGIGALVDFTNTDARDWYASLLRNLTTEAKVTSFNFVAGEASYLPLTFNTSVRIEDPNTFTQRFAELAFPFSDQAELQVGYHTQNISCFFRILDRTSNWGYSLGLKSVIPLVLTLGILGYPFVQIGTIGGNVPQNLTDRRPDRELYIRWLELAAFMPTMEFSVAPWEYDDNVVKIAKKFTALHLTLVAPMVLELANEVLFTGDPIIRPLWWIVPDEPPAYKVSSQFLIGEDFMVAPILEPGKRERDIYLPSGKWRSNRDHIYSRTPRLMTDYEVELDEVAYFTRVT